MRAASARAAASADGVAADGPSIHLPSRAVAGTSRMSFEAIEPLNVRRPLLAVEQSADVADLGPQPVDPPPLVREPRRDLPGARGVRRRQSLVQALPQLALELAADASPPPRPP